VVDSRGKYIGAKNVGENKSGRERFCLGAKTEFCSSRKSEKMERRVGADCRLVRIWKSPCGCKNSGKGKTGVLVLFLCIGGNVCCYLTAALPSVNCRSSCKETHRIANKETSGMGLLVAEGRFMKGQQRPQGTNKCSCIVLPPKNGCVVLHFRMGPDSAKSELSG